MYENTGAIHPLKRITTVPGSIRLMIYLDRQTLSLVYLTMPIHFCCAVILSNISLYFIYFILPFILFFIDEIYFTLLDNFEKYIHNRASYIQHSSSRLFKLIDSFYQIMGLVAFITSSNEQYLRFKFLQTDNFNGRLQFSDF